MENLETTANYKIKHKDYLLLSEPQDPLSLSYSSQYKGSMLKMSLKGREVSFKTDSCTHKMVES